MWIRELFGGAKPVIGMVHLDPLPGSVNYAGDLAKVISHAQQDYENLVAGGIDSVIFCNENDKPYAKKIGNETVAAMTAVILDVTGGRHDLHFGVDLQWDPTASLAVASAVGAKYIRGIVCGTFCGDLGFFTPDTEQIIKYRHAIGADNVRIMTNLMPEFSFSMDVRPPELVAQTVAKSTMSDAICVSGTMAGLAAPYEQLAAIKDAVPDFPVIANTGVNIDTIASILAIADACVVATCLKVDCKPENRIDTARVKKLMSALK